MSASRELVAAALGWHSPRGVRQAGAILERIGGLRGLLAAPEEELVAAGATKAQARRLRATLELVQVAEAPKPPIITCAKDVVSAVGELRLALEERLVVLCLNHRRALVNQTTVTVGNSRFTVVDPAQIYRLALVHRASAIILVHNHPSGDPTPSEQDREVTLRVERAGRVLGVPLLDHVVVATGGYASLAELGVIDYPTQSVWVASR